MQSIIRFYHSSFRMAAKFIHLEKAYWGLENTCLPSHDKMSYIVVLFSCSGMYFYITNNDKIL